MGAVKAAVMDGEEFACEHYNETREDFVNLASQEFGPASIEFYAAVAHFDLIQKEMNGYYQDDCPF